MIHFFKCRNLEHNFEFRTMELVPCVLTTDKSAKTIVKILRIFVSTHMRYITERKVLECFGAKSGA